jgi:hypothetical protein
MVITADGPHTHFVGHAAVGYFEFEGQVGRVAHLGHAKAY